MPRKKDPNRKRRTTPAQMKVHREWVAQQVAEGNTLNMRMIMDARGVAATTAVSLMNEAGYIPSKAWHKLSDIDKSSRTATCKKCGPNTRVYYRKHRDEWYCARKFNENHRGKSRGPHGLRQSEAQALRLNRVCEVCGSTDNLAVDHCHDTMLIRGILCRSCNQGVGHFYDNPDLLRSAAEYLIRTEGVDGLDRLLSS